MLGFELMFALIAALLSILSFKTLRAIRHLGVGKSFWIPVFLSSVVFLIGAITTILYEMGFSLTSQTIEVAQVSRILALCFLMCGIYSYSRKVKGSLREEFLVPEQLIKERLNLGSSDMNSLDSETPVCKERIPRRRVEKGLKEGTTSECKHQLGYLRTLPRNTSIPYECLDCDKIIECKHSFVKASENQTYSHAQKQKPPLD